MSCFFLTAILITASFDSVAAAEPKKVVGIVMSSKRANVNSPTLVAFRQALREFGWVEGENMLMEYRFADGVRERYANLVRDLVRLNVDVIVATGGRSVGVAKKMTKTIPIVMTNASNPVVAGFVASLAWPGGNITGVASLVRNLGGKRLELLTDSAPGLRSVTVLMDPTRPETDFKQAVEVAPKLGIQMFSVRTRTPEDLPEVFQEISQSRAGGVIVSTSPLFNSHRKRIAELASSHRIPVIYPDRRYVQNGGLLSYGPNIPEMFRRAASHVDKILRGAKPADLPVEQAMELELVINIKAAERIDLSIPAEVLRWADEVIE